MYYRFLCKFSTTSEDDHGFQWLKRGKSCSCNILMKGSRLLKGLINNKISV